MTEREKRIINGKEVILFRETDSDLYRFSKDVVDMLLQALEEVQPYRAIGTVEELKALKEKSVPKKAYGRYATIGTWDGGYCPNCGCGITSRWNYCQKCGQAIMWSEPYKRLECE